MSNVIFARPRHEYQSYSDLWKLVTLSDYDLCYIDEIDPDSDNTYIFSTPDADTGWPHTFPDARARIILWMLEWYDDYYARPGIAEVWNSSAWFAKRIGAKYVPMGSHPGLCELPHGTLQPNLYDVAHLFYVTNRRGQILAELARRGLRIAPADVWGVRRSTVLLQSRLMIHVHQSEHYPALPPLRACIAAAHKKAIYSERGYIDTFYINPCVMRSTAISPAEYARNLEAQIGIEDDAGELFYEHLCVKNTFRKTVEAAL